MKIVLIALCLVAVALAQIPAVPAQRQGTFHRNQCTNGRWVELTNSCPKTCENWPRGPKSCAYNLISRCECNSGHILKSTHSRECVRPQHCRR